MWTALTNLLAVVNDLAVTMGNALQLRGFKEGGTTGQVPVKGAGGDFDWSWSDPDAGVTSWNDLEDKPLVFPPDAHTHVVDDLTNITTYDLPGNNGPLASALDAKAPLASPAFTGTISAAALNVSGNISADHLSAYSLGVETVEAFSVETVDLTAIGTVSAADVTATGTLSASTVQGTGELRLKTSGNIRVFSTGGASFIVRNFTDNVNLFEVNNGGNGFFSGNISASGTVTGANFREGAQYPVTIGYTYSPTITYGSVITATLMSSTPCVITLPDPVSGQSFMIHLQQPSSGAPTTASWVGVDWGDAGEPTITPTLGKMDILSFVSNQAGTKWFGSCIQGFTY